MTVEDKVLAAIWLAVGMIGMFTLYGYLSPRIQRSKAQGPLPTA